MSTSFDPSTWVWRDGQLIPWADATVHVLSTAVQFGSSVFEGMRSYADAGSDGARIFRLQDHLKRLKHSASIYRMDYAYDMSTLTDACELLLRRNNLRDAYIRPMVLRGYGDMAMHGDTSPIEVIIACWKWGAYLGEEALQKGIDVCVSTWNRPAPNTFPGMAKGAGHYNNAQLIKMESIRRGYAEAVALKPDGTISEGSGQNLFAVIDGVLITNPIDGTNLRGLTRDSVIQLARQSGIEVREQVMPREYLYVADELFFTGTASEVTPIRSVDDIVVGEGTRGPVTGLLQQRFLDLVKGHSEDPFGWCHMVNFDTGKLDE